MAWTCMCVINDLTLWLEISFKTTDNDCENMK